MYEFRNMELELTYESGETEKKKIYNDVGKRRLDLVIDRGNYWELVQ